MSKYNECPYIELVLNEVSAENKAKLLNFINGKSADGTGTISFTLVTTVSALNSLDAGITPVAFKYNSTIVWNGYFIKTTNYKVFLTFKNGVDLTLGDLYRVDSLGLTFTEYVTSDNIRTLLREDAYIDASEIPTELPSTTEASAGQILGLDNDKNPEWKNNINLNEIKGNSIVENMSGYTFTPSEIPGYTYSVNYAGVVKNGNKLTFVLAFKIAKVDGANDSFTLGSFTIPEDVYDKLYPNDLGKIDQQQILIFTSIVGNTTQTIWLQKEVDNKIKLQIYLNAVSTSNGYGRIESTFLLSENLASSGE